MIPSKVTQQVVLAGRVLRDSQELVTACNVSHSRDAPFGSQGFPPFAQRLWGWNAGFRSRSAVTDACGAPRRVPGRGAPCSSARPRLPNSPVFSRCCKKATLRKPPSPQRTWVHRGAWCPRTLTLTVTGGSPRCWGLHGQIPQGPRVQASVPGTWSRSSPTSAPCRRRARSLPRVIGCAARGTSDDSEGALRSPRLPSWGSRTARCPNQHLLAPAPLRACGAALPGPLSRRVGPSSARPAPPRAAPDTPPRGGGPESGRGGRLVAWGSRRRCRHTHGRLQRVRALLRTLGVVDAAGVASERDTARRPRPGLRRRETRRAAGGAGGRRRCDPQAGRRGRTWRRLGWTRPREQSRRRLPQGCRSYRWSPPRRRLGSSPGR